jgi:hypothetical protein
MWFRGLAQIWTRQLSKIPPTFNRKSLRYKLYLSWKLSTFLKVWSKRVAKGVGLPTFQHIQNLSISGHFGIVFEHLWDYFQLEDSVGGFPQLFQLCSHITQGHIPCWITHILGVVHLLVMTKPLGGVCPIVIKKALYWLIGRNLCFQFQDAFATHLSPRQFGITTKGGSETIIHGI